MTLWIVVSLLQLGDSVRVVMEEMEAPGADGERMMGSRAYLDMCWKYTQIFYSKKLSIEKRVEYAAYVIHFLRLWRMYVFSTDGLTLSKNFITRETYQDTILSCHCFINSVRKMRDYSPGTALCIEKFGSDCCEHQFSAQGSWQQNKRNYSASTMQNCSQKENWLNYLKVNKDGPRWAQSKIHRREWDKEDEEGGAEIDFVVPADLDDEKIAACWNAGFNGARARLETMGMGQLQESEGHGNLNTWWASVNALAVRDAMHEVTMRHNRKQPLKGTDDMSSDAADEACFEHDADDLDPQVLVGRTVNFPADLLFGDDGVPDGCCGSGLAKIQSYRAGRRNKVACYELLVTHKQWPPEAPEVPTIFECQADDIHLLLSKSDFLRAPSLDVEGDQDYNDDGPDTTSTKKGKGRATAVGGMAADEGEWFATDGLGLGTGSQEVQDLLDMEAAEAAKPAFGVSAFVTTPAGKVIHKQRLVAMLNMCPTMSNDRLQRIAQGTRYRDEDAAPAEEMEGGKARAIELGSRVFVSCYDESRNQDRIWIGRVQKMGRKVEKRTIEYHNPVHLKRIPEGGFVYCHWYGKLPNTKNKWDYGVSDVNKIQMSQIKGVLKKRLTPANATKKNPNAMMLCDEDYKAYHSLDAVELGNQKPFAE